VERFIEEDAGMRGLRSQKLALEQEKAGAVASPVENRLLEARAARIDRQIEEARAELRGRGLADLRARAGDELAELEAQLAFMRSAGEQKRRGVETLDGALVEYRRKVEELKDQEAVLEKLRRQDVLLTLNSNTDAGRVQRIGGAGGVSGAGVGGGSGGGTGELVSPSLPVYLAAGGLGGLGASLLGAYLLLVTDHRIRTPRDITAGLGQPLLGFVPDARDDPARRLRNRAAGAGAALGAGGGLLEEGDVAEGEPVGDRGDAEGDGEGGGKRGGMMRDSFRRIRAQYAAQTAHTPVGTLLVASLSAGGGATSVAWSLAAGMARRERRVLLVDANFYRPALHHPCSPGFGDLLRDPELMESAIVPSQRIGRLHLLGAGRCCPELLEGNVLAVLLERLRARYDLIVFDGAPLDLVADSFTLAARVEGVIGVIRAGKVSRGAALRIREQLRLAHAHFLGFVLNAARPTSGGYFKETYRGFYRYASERGKAAR
jgi:Mrp family chromosome partitioning ATPase